MVRRFLKRHKRRHRMYIYKKKHLAIVQRVTLNTFLIRNNGTIWQFILIDALYAPHGEQQPINDDDVKRKMLAYFSNKFDK